MRAKLVAESLDQLFEEKDKEMANVSKTKEKYEKSDAHKSDEDKKSKAAQAIKGLEDQLAKAKKPGAFKTTTEKNTKVKELEDKIAAWKKKLA
jgi:hypothetical protein